MCATSSVCETISGCGPSGEVRSTIPVIGQVQFERCSAYMSTDKQKCNVPFRDQSIALSPNVDRSHPDEMGGLTIWVSSPPHGAQQSTKPWEEKYKVPTML
jgi:hypothetical protein